MTADELRRIAYHRPFRPFRVVLSSGEFLDITRTLRTTVGQDRVIFGVDEDAASGIARRMRIVSLADVASVEFTSAA